jgi:energy-coupling factor transport system substrate-specific component
MDKTKFYWLLAIILVVLTTYFRLEQYYLLISFGIIGLIIVPQYKKFEGSKLDSRNIVVSALIIAIASASRIPFATIPNVQPVSMIVILTGYVFGANTGFIVGSMTAIVSNMILGQGPWTPWQMVAWGMMGYFSSYFANLKSKRKILLSIFGFISGIIFGWMMDMWFLLGFIRPLNVSTILAAFTASLYFDILHAVTNFILIYVLHDSFMKKFKRIKDKYKL